MSDGELKRALGLVAMICGVVALWIGIADLLFRGLSLAGALLVLVLVYVAVGSIIYSEILEEDRDDVADDEPPPFEPFPGEEAAPSKSPVRKFGN